MSATSSHSVSQCGHITMVRRCSFGSCAKKGGSSVSLYGFPSNLILWSCLDFRVNAYMLYSKTSIIRIVRLSELTPCPQKFQCSFHFHCAAWWDDCYIVTLVNVLIMNKCIATVTCIEGNSISEITTDYCLTVL